MVGMSSPCARWRERRSRPASHPRTCGTSSCETWNGGVPRDRGTVRWRPRQLPARRTIRTGEQGPLVVRAREGTVMEYEEFLRSVPKVELHCHLEGTGRAA